MITKFKTTNKYCLSLAMTIGSALCLTNITLAETSNLEQTLTKKQEALELSIQNLSCLSFNELKLPSEMLVSQIIIDRRPSHDSRCDDYYTTYKNGKYYECIKCEYNREPYCWERNDLNQ
jgi:hypothetical protein